MLLVTLYSTFSCPFFVAFKLVYVIPSNTDGQLFTVLTECLMFLTFAADVGVQFMTGYYHMGGVVMDRRFIRRHYLRSGGFVLDALPLVPSLMLFLPPAVQLNKFVQVVKLLQLLKLHNFQERLWAVEEVIAGSVVVNTLWLVLLQLAIALFIVANLLACLWFWVQDERDGYVGGISGSWLASNPDLQEAIEGWLNLMDAQRSGEFREPIRDVDDDGTVCSETCVRYQLYVACIYWATSAGDSFDANSTPERLTAIGGQVVIVNAVASFIITGIMSAMEDFNDSVSKRSLYRAKIERVNVYLERNGIPREMRKLIRSYYRDVWVRKQIEFNDSELLEELPTTVKFPVMRFIVQGLVKNQKFFQDYLSAVTLDDTVIDDLALKMQPQFARCAPRGARAAAAAGRPGGARLTLHSRARQPRQHERVHHQPGRNRHGPVHDQDRQGGRGGRRPRRGGHDDLRAVLWRHRAHPGVLRRRVRRRRRAHGVHPRNHLLRALRAHQGGRAVRVGAQPGAAHGDGGGDDGARREEQGAEGEEHQDRGAQGREGRRPHHPQRRVSPRATPCTYIQNVSVSSDSTVLT